MYCDLTAFNFFKSQVHGVKHLNNSWFLDLLNPRLLLAYMVWKFGCAGDVLQPAHLLIRYSANAHWQIFREATFSLFIDPLPSNAYIQQSTPAYI